MSKTQKTKMLEKEFITDLGSRVRTSDTFRRDFNAEHYREMDSQSRRKMAREVFTAAALDEAIKETTPSGHKSHEGYYLQLMGNVEPFIAAQGTLDHMRDHGDSRESRKPYLRTVVEFNHALRDIINYAPDMSFTDLLGFMTSLHINLSGPDQRQYFFQEARSALIGMQNEIGFEQIIGNIDGLRYTDATVDQEIEDGIDMLIQYQGKKIPVDIKRSDTGVRNANSHNDGTKLNISPHIPFDAFNNGFRLDAAVAKRMAPRVERDIRSFISQRYLRRA